MDKISPSEYEAAILEKLERDFLPFGCRVEGTKNGKKFNFPGRYSGINRQLDAAVFKQGVSSPFLVADAKEHKRQIDVKNVEMFLGMMEDVGAEMGMLVCPQGYSKAARRRAKVQHLKCEVVSIEEAQNLNLLAEARLIYPWDWEFHPSMSSGLKFLKEKSGAVEFIESLGDLPFDEWEALCLHGLSKYKDETRQALIFIAEYHTDDAWRFNAVRLLGETYLLSASEFQIMLKKEIDIDTRELLIEFIGKV